SQGDIFTPAISAEFRKVIRATLAGPSGHAVHRTIQQGEPVGVELHVDQIYPPNVPLTTVPPTLLQRLPKLPPALKYRIVSKDFVLEDTRAELVIDFIHDALLEPMS